MNAKSSVVNSQSPTQSTTDRLVVTGFSSALCNVSSVVGSYLSCAVFLSHNKSYYYNISANDSATFTFYASH